MVDRWAKVFGKTNILVRPYERQQNKPNIVTDILQIKGWQRYFHENHIVPLSITYEEIEADVLDVIKRIAGYIGVDPAMVTMPKEVSIFKKMRDSRNTEWAQRFTLENTMPEQGTANEFAVKMVRTIKHMIKRSL